MAIGRVALVTILAIKKRAVNAHRISDKGQKNHKIFPLAMGAM
jgi:hypothetical protein